jgi:hypothetical protein
VPDTEKLQRYKVEKKKKKKAFSIGYAINTLIHVICIGRYCHLQFVSEKIGLIT